MTVSEIIDALGGTTAFAGALDISPSRVSNWRTFGRFPDSNTLYRQVLALCDQHGLTLDPTLFGQRQADTAA